MTLPLSHQRHHVLARQPGRPQPHQRGGGGHRRRTARDVGGHGALPRTALGAGRCRALARDACRRHGTAIRAPAKPQPGQEPPGRPAPPGGRKRGSRQSCGAPPALWPEAEGGATPRGRRRAYSASGRRPSRARTRARSRPRRPARSRSRVSARRTLARLAHVGRSRSRDFPLSPLAGFSLEPPLLVSATVDSMAAIDRVKGACHVIVAPLVARVATEHGLADRWGGPGAWRASRRRRRASGSGAGPGSGTHRAPAP